MTLPDSLNTGTVVAVVVVVVGGGSVVVGGKVVVEATDGRALVVGTPSVVDDESGLVHAATATVTAHANTAVRKVMGEIVPGPSRNVGTHKLHHAPG